MKTITLILDEARVKRFVGWLEYYIRKASHCPWASDGEKLFFWFTVYDMQSLGLWGEPMKVLIELGGSDIEDIIGLPTGAFDDCPEPRYYSELGRPSVTVEICTLSDSRIEVSLGAEVSDPAGCDFMQELYDDIIKRWREAQSPASPLSEKTPTPLEAYDEAYQSILNNMMSRKAQNLASVFSKDKPDPQEVPKEAVPASQRPAVEQKSVDYPSTPEEPLAKLSRLFEEEGVPSAIRQRRMKVLARRREKHRIEDIASEEGRGIRTINYDIAWLKERGFPL